MGYSITQQFNGHTMVLEYRTLQGARCALTRLLNQFNVSASYHNRQRFSARIKDDKCADVTLLDYCHARERYVLTDLSGKIIK